MWLCPWDLENVEKKKPQYIQYKYWFLCTQPSLTPGLCVPVLLLYYHSATLHLHGMLINHRSNPVTFALFKKKLQTLAFRKYNFLPLHISAALWAVYLTVFDYRLTFVLCFYFCQMELGWWEGTHKGCAFYDVAIQILPSVNMNRLCGLRHTGLAISIWWNEIAHIGSIFGVYIFFFVLLGGCLFVVSSSLHSSSLYDSVFHIFELKNALLFSGKGLDLWCNSGDCMKKIDF